MSFFKTCEECGIEINSYDYTVCKKCLIIITKREHENGNFKAKT